MALLERFVEGKSIAVRTDAMIGLRLLLESKASRPLSAQTLERVGDAAALGLRDKSSVVLLWRAIDLAIAFG